MVANLITNNFDLAEILSARKVVKQQTMELIEHGHTTYDKVTTSMLLFGEKVEAVLETPEDEFDFRLSCTLKSICVNSGQFQLLPWEALLWHKGFVPKHT